MCILLNVVMFLVVVADYWSICCNIPVDLLCVCALSLGDQCELSPLCHLWRTFRGVIN